jgi:hypothetical protein
MKNMGSDAMAWVREMDDRGGRVAEIGAPEHSF